MASGKLGRRPETEELIARVLDVLSELRDYWPLTLRQVYYRLVSAGIIENRQEEYKKLSRVLTDARMDKLVPWESMEDRSRSMLPSDGWSDEQSFVGTSLSDFLRGYRRDLLQSQPIALE